MKHTPGPDTEKSLTDRIGYYGSAAEWYAAHCQNRLAEWARGMAKQAAEQLDAMKKVGRESGDGE